MNSRIYCTWTKVDCIIPDNLAFVTDVTGTVEIYTFRGTYVGMDWSPLSLVSCTWIWEPFLSCLFSFY